jgi:hypothetical protein
MSLKQRHWEMAIGWLLRCVIAFEALRLVCWAVFISYLATGYSVAAGRENEAYMLVHMASLYLGFPYSWVGAVLTGALHASPSNPMAIAILQFFFWAVGSALLIWLVRLGRSHARIICSVGEREN